MPSSLSLSSLLSLLSLLSLALFSLPPLPASLHAPAAANSPSRRNRKARVRLRRRTAAPQDVQVLERRQVLHLALHPQALRTAPGTRAHAHTYTQGHVLTATQWNGFVELLPLWIAPNLVTLLGFFFILGNVILLELYVPDLVGPAPSWVYYSFAFGMWMYSTMDNVDGKQARRTGTSSPLGELFECVT
jgi:hypothetical protein